MPDRPEPSQHSENRLPVRLSTRCRPFRTRILRDEPIDPADRSRPGRCLRCAGLAAPRFSADPGPTRSRGPRPRPRRGPAPTAGLEAIEVFPPEINLTTARDRQSIVVQATYADGITRDVTREASITPANPALLKRDGATFYPVADGATTLAVAFGGQTVTVPVKVAQATVAAAAQLPARRDAGLHAGRLQHRELPRRGPRQGRLPDLALRLRPRGRPLPADPRDGRPADQPGGPVRQHPAREVHRRGPAHRRQAVRAVQRALPDAPSLDRGRRPERRRDQAAQGRRRRPLSQGRRARRQGLDPADDRAGPLLRRHRPRRHQPGRLPHEQRGLGRRQPRRPRHRGRARRGVRHGPVRDLHRRLAVHRAAQGPEVRVPRRSPRPTTSTRWSPTSSSKLRIAPSGICDDATFLRRVYLDIVGLHADRRGVQPVHEPRPTRPSGPS